MANQGNSDKPRMKCVQTVVVACLSENYRFPIVLPGMGGDKLYVLVFQEMHIYLMFSVCRAMSSGQGVLCRVE